MSAGTRSTTSSSAFPATGTRGGWIRSSRSARSSCCTAGRTGSASTTASSSSSAGCSTTARSSSTGRRSAGRCRSASSSAAGPPSWPSAAPAVSDRSHRDDAIAFRAGRVYTFQDTQGLVPHRILEQDQADKTPGAEPYDRFGWSLAAGDFDANGHDDLAVGAPFETVGKLAEAGEVDVFGGAPGGLPDGGTDQLVQLQAGGVIEAGDWFGFSLAAGDYDGDGWADLAVGAPHEWVGAAVAAGAVSVVRGDDGMVAETGTILTQGAGTIPDTSESRDRFGTSVATIGLLGDQDLIIGVPGEGGPSTLPDTSAGAVVLTVAGGQTHGPVGDPTLLLHQDSPAPYDVADQREPAAAIMPYDMTHGEVLNGPQPAEPTGEWFGWSIAS